MSPLASGEVAQSNSKATAADASGYGSATFYPLSIGSAWTYEGGGSFGYLRDGVPSGPDFRYAFTETHELIGTTRHEGTTYVVEEQVHRDIPESYYGPATWWDRVRQDAGGLFSLDTFLQEPPILESGKAAASPAGNGRGRALQADLAAWHPGGAADAALQRLAERVEALRDLARGVARHRGETTQELTRLVYPLRPGTSWSIRPDFPWPARVDRVEILNTPAGRKTAYRIDLNPFGTVVQEGEWVRVWFSREGYLGYSIHSFEEETNENGEPTGSTFVADESMTVTSVDLAR